MAQQQLTPGQKAEMFGRQTRQYVQAQAGVSGSAGETISFDLVKTRLASKIQLLVEAVVKVTHASQTSFLAHPFAPYTLFQTNRVDINNGFSPFTVSGEQLAMYNMIRDDAQVLDRAASGRSKIVMPTVASSAGTSNALTFMMDMPIAINDRDPIGLIMTQNQATTVTVQQTITSNAAALLAPGQTGFTVEIVSVKVTPVITSFAIPQNPEALPALTTVKLVQATSNDVQGGGLHDLKLTPGYTYRKIAFYVTDANGVGVSDDDLAGMIEIVMNQSDFPYRLPAKALARINHDQFGKPLPAGMFVFDFTYQGFSNYGGNRDYIDTERLTEFWVRFNAKNPGKVQAVYETLTIMR